MKKEKKEAIMASKTFEELLDAEYGKQGTPARDGFDVEAEAFCLAECLKEQRRLAGLTQEELASKIGTKKSYIRPCRHTTLDIVSHIRRTRKACFADRFIDPYIRHLADKKFPRFSRTRGTLFFY